MHGHAQSGALSQILAPRPPASFTSRTDSSQRNQRNIDHNALMPATDTITADAVREAVEDFAASPDTALSTFDLLYPLAQPLRHIGSGHKGGKGGYRASAVEKTSHEVLKRRFWVAALYNGLHAHRQQSISEFVNGDGETASIPDDILQGPWFKELSRICDSWGDRFKEVLFNEGIILQQDPSKSLIEQLARFANEFKRIEDFTNQFRSFWSSYDKGGLNKGGRRAPADIVTASVLQNFGLTLMQASCDKQAQATTSQGTMESAARTRAKRVKRTHLQIDGDEPDARSQASTQQRQSVEPATPEAARRMPSRLPQDKPVLEDTEFGQNPGSACASPLSTVNLFSQMIPESSDEDGREPHGGSPQLRPSPSPPRDCRRVLVFQDIQQTRKPEHPEMRDDAVSNRVDSPADDVDTNDSSSDSSTELPSTGIPGYRSQGCQTRLDDTDTADGRKHQLEAALSVLRKDRRCSNLSVNFIEIMRDQRNAHKLLEEAQIFEQTLAQTLNSKLNAMRLVMKDKSGSTPTLGEAKSKLEQLAAKIDSRTSRIRELESISLDFSFDSDMSEEAEPGFPETILGQIARHEECVARCDKEYAFLERVITECSSLRPQIQNARQAVREAKERCQKDVQVLDAVATLSTFLADGQKDDVSQTIDDDGGGL